MGVGSLPGGANTSRSDLRLIRAFAVVTIVACHILEGYEHFAAWWLNAGVQVFLFISGYVFGIRAIRDWRVWFRRRLLRILPAYYLLVVLVLLIHGLVLGVGGLGREFLASLFCVQDFFKICLPGCDHLWFITLILVCYLMVPVLQALRERVTDFAAYSAINFLALPVVFFLVYKICDFMTYAYVANLTAFAWGYYFAVSRERLAESPGTRAAAAAAVALAMLILGGRGVVEFLDLADAGWWGTIHAKLLLPWSKVGFAVALFILLAGRSWKMASSRLVGFIDEYSYEIYLTHHLFIFGSFALLAAVPSKLAAVAMVIALTAVSSMLLKRLAGWMATRTENGPTGKLGGISESSSPAASRS